MIPKINDFENVQAAHVGGFEKLPAGGYEAKIIDSKVAENQNGGQRLEIAVDITAGEFKDYFKNQYESSSFDDKKWKGVARFFLPIEDGSKKDNFKKRLFKAMTQALEQSNPSYRWDWNEQKLKGLKVGIMVRDKEYDFDGHYGFAPEIFEFVDIKIIKSGEFSTPAPRYLNGKSPKEAAADYSGVPAPDFAATSDDTYPF